jgi:hypothetical protein|tara:strand:+ start:259 stop:780 length:522 start_codon:yes stop_codon:yes gene_type:complete
MKNRQIWTITLAVLLIGCAASIPSWYNKLPQKKGFKYAVGTERGDEIQNAVDEATRIAVRNIAQQNGSEISGNILRAQDEVDDKTQIDNFVSVQEEVFSLELRDWQVIKQEIKKDGRNFHRAFVLVEWDANAAQDRLLQRIKNDEKLFKALKTTALYEDMEKKVEEYRKRRDR